MTQTVPAQILLLSRDADAYVEALAPWLDEGVVVHQASSPSVLTPASSASEIVLGDPDLIVPALQQLPRLRWIQSTWAGLTPLLPAAKSGIAVSGVKGVFGAQMSEFVLGYLLHHTLHIAQRRQAQERREWLDKPTGTLAGKTLGILGTGSIAAHIAGQCQPFFSRVLGLSRSGADVPGFDAVFSSAQLLGFLGQLDCLVGVLPDTPQTRGLLDAAALQALSPGAVIINVGRGSLIDESALCAALNSGHLGAAILDVFNQEPLAPTHEFWGTPGLTVTAHVAARSWPEDSAQVFKSNYQRFTAGEKLEYLLDPERGY
jgi:phosphoglycerate dehydrogenase-like enzyme